MQRFEFIVFIQIYELQRYGEDTEGYIEVLYLGKMNIGLTRFGDKYIFRYVNEEYKKLLPDNGLRQRYLRLR